MLFNRLVLIATIIAFVTIILGANARLSNAGLGCPDWPGCYGQLIVPDSQAEVLQANEDFPNTPLRPKKAWKEMFHRYVAGTLGLLILLLAMLAWKRRAIENQPIALPFCLLALVIFQAILGMWTVTLLLKPLVVVMHLLFGFATLALLFWLSIATLGRQTNNMATNGDFKKTAIQAASKYKIAALLGLLILICQIALGGWTSSNYAALICPDFPTCQGQWIPEMNYQDAFVLWRGLGINYEGGVLNSDARTAIHFTHRLGAIITLIYMLGLAMSLIKNNPGQILQKIGILLACLVCLQFALGLANIYFSLPLVIATSHNAVAALLLLCLVLLNYVLYPNHLKIRASASR